MKAHHTVLLLYTILLFVIICCHQSCLGDIPVSCEFPHVYGEWTFQQTRRIYDKNVIFNECSIDQPHLPPSQQAYETFIVELAIPDRALLKNENGHVVQVGHWTLMWNQAMEIRLNDMKYFAFFNYTLENGKPISHCDRVFVGTFHDNSIGAKHWGCFTGMRTKNPTTTSTTMESISMESTSEEDEEGNIVSKLGQYSKYDSYVEYVNRLNLIQNNWIAGMNERFNGIPISTLQNMGNQIRKFNSKSFIENQMKKNGMIKNGMIRLYNGKTNSYEIVNEIQLRNSLPKEFTWTNKDGLNYVTPIRNQFNCGSCYAFGTSVMISDRLRILSNLTRREIYSPQAIVDCSPYSQGCSGGCSFSSSKFAQDYGLVLDSCDPINESSSIAQSCNISLQCREYDKIHVLNYYNVGGYYGGSNELNMMHDIYHHGPHVAGFMVKNDFFYYKNGIYSHVPNKEVLSSMGELNIELPPFYYINHVLTIVGWGEENGIKYWLAKNSWGDKWGNAGYAKVLRGVNECGIESDAEAGIPLI